MDFLADKEDSIRLESLKLAGTLRLYEELVRIANESPDPVFRRNALIALPME